MGVSTEVLMWNLSSSEQIKDPVNIPLSSIPAVIPPVTMITEDGSFTDEEAPLMGYELEESQKSLKPTPLPWLQFSTLFLLRLAEHLTANVTYPFIPDLVRNIGITHGDEKKVGFYVGMLQTALYLTATATVFHCCWVSDRIGRRPVLLTGVLGLCISMVAFGLSKTFWALFLCQLISGALHGSTGVIKSVLVEITDSTSLARAWGYLTASWCVASSLGSVIGGSLSRPADQLPQIFGSSEFLKKYPYFLPCAVCSSILFIIWVIGFLNLKETVHQPIPLSSLFKRKIRRDAQAGTSSSPGEARGSDINDNPPLPFRMILTPKVLMAATNYAILSLVDIAFVAMQPVILSTPIQDGGLGFTPHIIGSIASVYAILTGICQLFIFSTMHKRLGTRNLFIIGTFATIPTYALWPVMNWMARRGYVTMQWFALALQVFFAILTQLSFGAIMISIAKSPPTRGSLGATIGFCQVASNVVGAIGPALCNSLFSLSIGGGYLGGQLIYVVLILVGILALYMAFRLPRDDDDQDIG